MSCAHSLLPVHVRQILEIYPGLSRGAQICVQKQVQADIHVRRVHDPTGLITDRNIAAEAWVCTITSEAAADDMTIAPGNAHIMPTRAPSNVCHLGARPARYTHWAYWVYWVYWAYMAYQVRSYGWIMSVRTCNLQGFLLHDEEGSFETGRTCNAPDLEDMQ